MQINRVARVVIKSCMYFFRDAHSGGMDETVHSICSSLVEENSRGHPAHRTLRSVHGEQQKYYEPDIMRPMYTSDISLCACALNLEMHPDLKKSEV
jgi:hypothetical protein